MSRKRARGNSRRLPPQEGRGQRRLRRFGLPALALAALVALILGASAWLPLPIAAGDVRIEGEFQLLDPEQLRQGLAEHLPSSFFAVSLNSIRADLEKMPWVAQVRVLRTWPPGLTVQVREHHPAARWAGTDYLDPEGRMFPALDRDDTPLPQLAGPPDRAAETLAHYRQMAQLLSSVGLDLQGLRLEPGCCWHLRLACGGQLVAGQDGWHPALQRFVRAYPALAASRDTPLARVDLRYSNGLAAAWQQSAPLSCGTKASSQEWHL